jgi:hypothetical protein
MINLFYLCVRANEDGETRHPQDVMSALGIKYVHATSHMIAESWKFYNCTNVPDPMPRFLVVNNQPLESMIGYGLSETDVKILKGEWKND